jgi:hypothetical protein
MVIGIFPNVSTLTLDSKVKTQQVSRYIFLYFAFLAQWSVEFGDNSFGGQGKLIIFIVVV